MLIGSGIKKSFKNVLPKEVIYFIDPLTHEIKTILIKQIKPKDPRFPEHTVFEYYLIEKGFIIPDTNALKEANIDFDFELPTRTIYLPDNAHLALVSTKPPTVYATTEQILKDFKSK